MPIYEYQCGDCGHKLEIMQRLSEDPLKDCPSCGAGELRKLISSVGFRLKGTGWYETDFKNKGKAAEKKGDDGDGAKKPAEDKAADKPAESKTDSSEKPVTKPPASSDTAD